MTRNMHRSVLLLGAVAVSAAMVAAGAAQVVYAPRAPVDLSLLPYDESYGTSPSFEVSPYRYGGAGVRVVERCQYPNGWNATDFARDVNGTPAGLDHTCSVAGARLHARY